MVQSLADAGGTRQADGPPVAVAPLSPVAMPPVAVPPAPRARGTWLALPGLAPALSLLCFLLLWSLAAWWVQSPIQLPAPASVASALVDLARDGELWDNVSISFVRLLGSMALAIGLAVPLGVAMGLSPLLAEFVDPLLEMLRPISGIAWIPLGLFIFGIGGTLPVFIMTYVAFFPVLLNTVAAVRGTDKKLLAAARTMGVSPARIVRLVVLPGALPTMMVGIRIAFAGAWAAIIAAELIGSPSGLGFAIEWYRELLMTPAVFAYLVVVAVVGYVCDLLLQWLRRRLTPWARGTGLQ